MTLRFHHVCIETACYEQSLNFYETILGFTKLHETPDFHGRAFNTWLKHGNIIIELQTPKKSVQTAPGTANTGLMHICFELDDLDAFLTELEARGFSNFVEGKRKYKVLDSYLSKIVAPEGTIIELR